MSVKTYKLTNNNGMAITVTNLGCAIISLEMPDRHGKIRDIVLGLNNAEDYGTVNHPCCGVICGRVANRIGRGKFTLSGKNYQLETNIGANHLHGGNSGFDKKIWQVKEASENKISFTYNSPCGDANYPGNLVANVTYILDDTNTLRIDYNTTTDTETICNLTNHSYFNLSGHDSANIYDHVLEIVSDKITVVDDEFIPTGEFLDVTGTPFDFRTPRAIGEDIELCINSTSETMLSKAGGYDHNYVLRAPGKAASVYSPQSGICMTVYTNSPGMQLYTSNMMPTGDKSVTGKGAIYGRHSGFCFETQIFPDAINKPHFPSCIVTKDKPQQFYTEFKFTVQA